MLKKDLERELERDRVSNEIIQAVFLAYDYLNDSTKCVEGSAYSWEVADAVLGMPRMSWSTTRLKMQTALSLLENKEVFEQRKTDLKYIIKNRLED